MDEFSDVRQAIAENNLEEARDLLRDYIKQQADSAEVWYLAAKAAVNEAQRTAFLEKAVEIDPLHADAANELHDLRHSRNQKILSEPIVNRTDAYDFDLSAPVITEDSPRYADLGERFAAFMIDQILLMIALIPFVYLTLLSVMSNEAALSQASAARGWSIILSAGVLLQAAYYAYFLTQREGQTIGKKMMKVRVIKRDGSRLTIWDAVLRSIIGYIFSVLALGLGFAWAAFDKQSQGWHDMIADTIVVEA
jgi:uncharacterized RDD family membrane protein YckC